MMFWFLHYREVCVRGEGVIVSIFLSLAQFSAARGDPGIYNLSKFMA